MSGLQVLAVFLSVLILDGHRHFQKKRLRKPMRYEVLLREIIPRYGLSLTIGRDNGPSFVAEIIQKLAKELKNQMKSPHCV